MGRICLSVAIVAAIAIITGIIVVAIVDAVDPLRGEVAVALAPIERKILGGLDMVIADGPRTGAAEGLQVALLGVLLGGMPSAFISVGLEARTRRLRGHWRSDWGRCVRQDSSSSSAV